MGGEPTGSHREFACHPLRSRCRRGPSSPSIRPSNLPVFHVERLRHPLPRLAGRTGGRPARLTKQAGEGTGRSAPSAAARRRRFRGATPGPARERRGLIIGASASREGARRVGIACRAARTRRAERPALSKAGPRSAKATTRSAAGHQVLAGGATLLFHVEHERHPLQRLPFGLGGRPAQLTKQAGAGAGRSAPSAAARRRRFRGATPGPARERRGLIIGASASEEGARRAGIACRAARTRRAERPARSKAGPRSGRDRNRRPPVAADEAGRRRDGPERAIRSRPSSPAPRRDARTSTRAPWPHHRRERFIEGTRRVGIASRAARTRRAERPARSKAGSRSAQPPASAARGSSRLHPVPPPGPGAPCSTWNINTLPGQPDAPPAPRKTTPPLSCFT
jgi:hypothetical protein